MAKEHRRIKKIDARFTEDEYKVVEGLERSLGMSKTDLVRSRLLNTGAQLSIDAKALLTELNAIGAELGRSGNNINQLARHANVLNKKGKIDQPVIEHFNNLFTGYLENQQKLEIALRKILRSMVA